jgi:hypothetical protein
MPIAGPLPAYFADMLGRRLTHRVQIIRGLELNPKDIPLKLPPPLTSPGTERSRMECYALHEKRPPPLQRACLDVIVGRQARADARQVAVPDVELAGA